MATAIKLKNTRETFLNNVFITGFNKGVEAINSKLTLNKVNIQKCNVGLELNNSHAIVRRSVMINNGIDVIVNKSKAIMINTIVRRIIELLPNNEIRINPYRIRNLAFSVINTQNIKEKRKRLKNLLNTLNKYSKIWKIYLILKEILSLVGFFID